MARYGRAAAVVLALLVGLAVRAEPLASWSEGAARTAIVEFVEALTRPGSRDHLPPEERIAVFDNDGTLWSEKPAYFQLLFAIDRVKTLAPQHPEWREQQPFRAALEGDMETLAHAGVEGLLRLVMASHAGMTTQEFEAIVRDWIRTARHPERDRPYTELVYQPMLELLAYLRENGFETWIVSGGGVEFLRPWVGEIYGIPPQWVVGSSVETRFELREAGPVLVRLPELHFLNDGPGKPIGIHRHIGRRPVVAIGNSDGDLEMLQWATAGPGRRLGVLVHHTDAEREWAYDRDSAVGHLDEALDRATERGWMVVDMKRDWKRVHATSE